MEAYLDLPPGTLVKVSPPGDPLGAAYESTVRSVLPAGVRLTLPRHDRHVLAVEPGASLTMFTTERGAVYRFHAPVRLVEPDKNAFVIEPPSRVERTERRQFFRLVTRIVPRRASLLDDRGNEVEELQVAILDLSGGGALLQSRQPVEPGSRVRLVFALEGDPLEMDLAALVVSVTRPMGSSQSYRLHCQFLQPDRSETDRLVRFIYRQQLAERRRGVV